MQHLRSRGVKQLFPKRPSSSLATLKNINVYGRPTVRVVKVHWMLDELGVHYEKVEDLPSPAPESYALEVNPTGLVPSIQFDLDDPHGGDSSYVVSDSNAICSFLAQAAGGPIFPSESLVFARAAQWSDFVENYMCAPRLNQVFHARVRKAYPPATRKPGCPPVSEVDVHVARSVEALRIFNDFLAARPLDQTYVAGPDWTYADATIGPWVHRWVKYSASLGPELATARFPGILRYHDEALVPRPAFVAAVANRMI